MKSEPPVTAAVVGDRWDGNGSEKPLCVDLDGTLIRTDLLVEGIVKIFVKNLSLDAFFDLLTFNQASLKRNVATRVGVHPEVLPYNEKVVGYLKKELERGRRIVLATAADRAGAYAIANHLGLFDEVICSDGEINLKGKKKATALVGRFGARGFDYIGNDTSDLAVWRQADQVIAANASGAVIRAAKRLGRPMSVVADRPSPLRAAFRAMRPHQWSKNFLVFVPILTAQAVFDVTAWIATMVLFAAFCAVASSIYLVNDVLDIESDRSHPRKRNRPIANGSLPIPVAGALSVFLIVCGMALAVRAGGLSVVLLYAFSSVAYSAGLKRFPIVDVIILAGLYTLRVQGGALVSGHYATVWLLAFSGFTFLSLGLVKRVAELQESIAKENQKLNAARGYRALDLDLMRNFGVASTFSSSVVLAMFVSSTSAFQNYKSPETLWLIVPLILMWQCRLWLATIRGSMHDDPIVYASRDWVTWLVFGAVLMVLLGASLGINVTR
jgi:4-hydroxybenzoate polyprenyltransferase